MASFSGALHLVLFLAALSLETSCFPTGTNLRNFSRAVLSLTNDTLGVGYMKEFYDSLLYKKVKKSVSAEQVGNHVSLMFEQQQKALGRIKERVELVYRNGDFTDREKTTQCCHVTNLTDSQEFGLPISEKQSCDRISGIASKSAYSLYEKLDAVFEENHQVPVKWQYFGSEKGILNQFPSSRPADCGSYDNRFRPWYKGSATPNPKDVVIVIKQNPFPSPRPLFEAADIILRTLNPRDRVALVIFNEGVLTNVIDGCYATYLSLATPANVNLFQKFLKTLPTPRDGNAMSEALEAAYMYYDLDIAIASSGSGMQHNVTLNITTKTRDRAIVFLTDAARVSDEEMEKTKAVLEKYCIKLTMVSIFILYSNDAIFPRELLNFYQMIVDGVFDGSIDNLIQIDARGDLRHSITNFYTKFASQTQHSAEYKPVFMVPYYDVFGLEQLVMTLSTPCYNAEADGKLLGVASVDFTVSDIFASAEYFTQGDLSYAFVIDRDGLVLLHPLLPFPSTTSAAVYLDISTLEPQPGFELIRESMINGSSGSMELESRAILSRGRSIHHGLHFLTIMCNYSWAPIKNTPFSVCVVVPMDAYDCHYFKDTFKAPINAQYHMLDMLLDSSGLCRHVSQYATPDYSTVALFPEAFSLNHGTEWRSESEYVQEALTSLNDWKQLFKAGILDTVAATANAEKVWLQLDHDHGNCDHGNSIHDYIAWRYIASSSGVMRIYPGTQIDTTGRKANQYPWYHNAVADVDSVSISPPHHDTIRTGHTVSLSKAIVRKCDSKDPKVKWLKCGVEAVMGMDVAHGHLWKLLLDTVEICRKTKYRCMLIDSNAYVIVHPRFFNNPDSVTSLHLSAFEPFLMHNMYHLKLVNRVYCNNFQYNSEFTRRPRKQFFYELTKKVRNATAPLEGGGISQCVFYSIVPVEGTNTFFVVVDNERSSDPICKPVSCPCDPEQPCSSLPGFCMCPCVEEIPPENYNSCLESFTGLCAHVCPPLTGLQDHSVTMVTNPIDEGVKACYPQNCSQKATPLDCLSNVVCEVVTNVLKNGTLNFACREIGFTAPTTKAGSERGENNEANNALIWPIVSGVLLLALLLTVFCSVVHCVRGRQVARRVRPGRGRVNTASTNMTSVTDSSVENSLRRQDSSQEHSCSSEEALPSVAQDGTSSPGCGGHKMNMVPSIATCGSYVTAAENGGIVNTAGGKEDRGRQEGEGKCSGDDVFPPQQKDDNDQKATGSFPSSLGTTGTHDLFSKLGESPDPSKAGGIWF